MPYVFGSLVLLNAAVLGYYLFFQQPSPSQSLKNAEAALIQPLDFTNSVEHIAPVIGNKG